MDSNVDELRRQVEQEKLKKEARERKKAEAKRAELEDLRRQVEEAKNAKEISKLKKELEAERERQRLREERDHLLRKKLEREKKEQLLATLQELNRERREKIRAKAAEQRQKKLKQKEELERLIADTRKAREVEQMKKEVELLKLEQEIQVVRERKELAHQVEKHRELVRLGEQRDALQQALLKQREAEKARLEGDVKKVKDLEEGIAALRYEAEVELVPAAWDTKLHWGAECEAELVTCSFPRSVHDLIRGPSIAPPPRNVEKVRIRERPFDYGTQRFAFHLEFRGERWVAKRFKKPHAVRDIQKNVLQMYTTMVASFLADRFMEAVRKSKCDIKSLSYLEVMVLGVKGEYWMAEKLMDGRFEKMNNNDGWVKDEGGVTAQAFSHFTEHFTRGQLIVVDVQGVRQDNQYCLTDPAIHTSAACDHFGGTNLGEEGIKKFFSSHACNSYCQKLGLSSDRAAKGVKILEATKIK